MYLLWGNVYSDLLPIFNWFISHFIIELLEFFMYSRYKSLIRQTYSQKFVHLQWVDLIIMITRIGTSPGSDPAVAATPGLLPLIFVTTWRCRCMTRRLLVRSGGHRSVRAGCALPRPLPARTLTLLPASGVSLAAPVSVLTSVLPSEPFLTWAAQSLPGLGPLVLACSRCGQTGKGTLCPASVC